MVRTLSNGIEGGQAMTPKTMKRVTQGFDSAMLRAHFQGDDLSEGLPFMDPPLKIYNQPRGGVIIETKCGNVQFGMPPETIKDCLASGLQVPQVR
jgi:hypothetical protein